MQDSIFTKIIRGEIPCYKVYEDELTFAILTISPITPGHTLVIPKKQVDHLWDLDDQTYQAVMATSKKVANRLREVLQPPRVAVHVAGFEVPHAHIHVFPADTTEDMYRSPMEIAPSEDALTKMAGQLHMKNTV